MLSKQGKMLTEANFSTAYKHQSFVTEMLDTSLEPDYLYIKLGNVL
jgi:hypothetical protein